MCAYEKQIIRMNILYFLNYIINIIVSSPLWMRGFAKYANKRRKNILIKNVKQKANSL